MKTLWKSLFILALGAFAFSSCEDVPEPYPTPGQENGGTETPAEPTGDGTLDNPFNVVAALEKITVLDATTETEPMYVKGKICSIKTIETAQYGNANYYISDNGKDTKDTRLYIFQSYYLGNVKFTSEDQIKIGDEVVIYGRFVNYQGNTPETVGKGTSYIYSLNGKTDSSNTPEDPTPDKGSYINETFSKSFGSFSVHTVNGNAWVLDTYGYAKATGYDNASKTTTPSSSYLVSSPVDMSTSKEAIVNFDYILRYVTTSAGEAINGIVNKVLVTDNYTDNPSTTNWIDITGDLKEVKDWNSWQKFSVAVPTDLIGKPNVTFALYYACETSSGTWEVKNFTVKEGKNENEGDNNDNTGKDDNVGDPNSANGDFEAWENGLPVNWKTESTAGNATLSQSTDAHNGNYSVKVAGATQNKRLSYKELNLKPGEYTMTFYTKAAGTNAGSCRPGYAIVVDGKISGGNDYIYGDYVNDIKGDWTLVTHNFTIDKEGTYCVLIMNSKNKGDLLIDDFTLTMGDEIIIK